MKIGFSPESIVGLDGIPLVGRVTLYAHDSDTKIDVYTLEGDAFVQAANPQLLDNAGRLPATLFFEASIVDVKVEKYIGAEDMMSVDSPNSDFETFDTFEIGFDAESLRPRYVVDTIEDLEEVDVSTKYVTVMGYYAVGDCVPRTYVWDADSQDAIDGGYVVGSSNEDSGRWILLWNSSTIPSSVYGVIAGVNETNISAFLSYPSVVGSFLQKTSQAPRFEKGTYTTDVNLITTKDVAFDRGARFTTANIQLATAIVDGGWDGYIADLTFTDETAVAHSSWFRTAEGFFKCDAYEYIVDKTYYFTNISINSSVTLTRKKFVATTLLNVTYGENGRIGFNGCAIVGKRFLSSFDRVHFANTEFRDEWFNITPNAFDFVNKISCRTTENNVLNLANFKSVDVYVKAVTADEATSIDLAGRYIASLETEQFTEIRNAVCGSLHVSIGGGSVKLKNVRTDSLIAACQFLYIEQSDVNLGNPPTLQSLTIQNSRVVSSSSTPLEFGSVQATDSIIGFNIDNVVDNVSHAQVTRFDNCTLKGVNFSVKLLSLYGCLVTDSTIKVYPFKYVNDLNEQRYKLYANFVGNSFVGSTPIEFTKRNNDEDCYDIDAEWTIVGNSFVGNDEGLRCRFWADSDMNNNVFMSYKGNVTYSGNTGNCPRETASEGMAAENSDLGNWVQFQIGSVWVSLYNYSMDYQHGFVMPAFNTPISEAYYYYDVLPYRVTLCVKSFQSNTNFANGKNASMYPVATLSREPGDNGSFFEYEFAIQEKVVEGTPGNIATWRFI